MKTKPFVVFVFAHEGSETSPRYGGFAKRLQKAGMLPDHEVVTVALENLLFCIDKKNNAQITDMVSGVQLDKASFVYLKSWEAMPEEAAALATFLHYRGVPFADNLALGMGFSKLAVAFRLWANGVKSPPTIYVRRADRLKAALDKYRLMLGKKFIVKDIFGEKGRLNYLASDSEVSRILANNPDKCFVCQRFIPNDGDYRIGVYMNEAAFAIKRTGNGDSHLNNTSAGGRAVYMPIKGLPIELTELAVNAAEAAGLQIAGVDIIVDKDSQEPYVLEVNQGSQIVTGAFVDENMQAFAERFNRAVKKRYAKSLQKPLKVIGRRETVSLPDLGIKQAVAKIDTGAYSTALHAENIHEEIRQGVPELVFEVQSSEYLEMEDDKPRIVRTPDFSKLEVRSSNGTFQIRYAIHTNLELAGEIVNTRVTLVDRSSMRHPLLIGRKALRSRFLIHVELAGADRPE